MSRGNVETVRLGYEVAYVERSVEKVRDVLAEHYVFHAPPDWPGRNSYRGDEVTELWADLDQTYRDFSLVPEDFEAFGDYVVVTVKTSARLRDSDTRIEATRYHVWHVLNGKAQETRAYSSRVEALEAVGLREQAMSQENVEVMREAYAAIAGDDLDAFLALAHPEIEFRSLIAEAEGRTYRGHEGVRDWWDSVIRSLGVRPGPEKIEGSRDRGITRLRLAGQIAGVEVPQAMWMAWRLRDGLLVWWMTFRTEREALEAVGLRE